jgi:fucose 4-O-acetylase-like acetyltransferase
MLREDVSDTPVLLKVDGRYLCADNLRFACILAVIAVHTAKLLAVGAPHNSAIELFQVAAISMVKFGTIGFFMISGFLLEKNLQTRSPIDLIRRRIQKVLLPWTFWFVISTVAMSAVDFVEHKRAFLPGTPLAISLGKTSLQVFTGTALWFVPNLLLSLVVLIVFRRYLHSLVFGAALLTVTLFYSLNIYTDWIDTHHTRAFFGFIFYLWLGHYAAIHVGRLSDFLRSIPTSLLCSAALLLVIAEFAEALLLSRLHAVDPLNTLKISTQIFSVVVFLLFFKVQRRLWPVSFDVSRTTFGMYLSHVILLAAVTSPLWSLMNQAPSHPLLGRFVVRLAVWLGATALVSAFSFALARAFSASPSLGWIVGSPRRTSHVRALEVDSSSATTAV